jgi:hypothetical protein
VGVGAAAAEGAGAGVVASGVGEAVAVADGRALAELVAGVGAAALPRFAMAATTIAMITSRAAIPPPMARRRFRREGALRGVSVLTVHSLSWSEISNFTFASVRISPPLRRG